MKLRSVFAVVVGISLLVTVLIQRGLTHAIFFEGYTAHPFIVAENDDELFYLTLIQEASKSNGLRKGSPYSIEKRDDQFTYPLLGVKLVGTIGSLFSMDVKTMSIILDYIAVFGVCVLVLISSWLFFSRSWIGVVVGSLYLGVPIVFGTLSRPISPQVNALFLFGWLCLFFLRPKTRGLLALLGISAGLLFSVYPYYWTFVFVWMALDEMVLLFRNAWTKQRLWMYGGLLIAALPYVLHVGSAQGLPYYTESMARLGLLHDRFPAGFLTLLMVLVVAIPLGVYWKRAANEEHRRQAIICVTGLCTSVIVLTQQLITGVQLEANAHYFHVIIYVLLLGVGILWQATAVIWGAKRRMWHVLIPIAFLGTVFAPRLADAFRVSPLSESRENQTFPATEAEKEVYLWFRKQKIENTVVHSPAGMEDRIVLYTRNYVPFSSLQRLLLISNQEMMERYQYADVSTESVDDRKKISFLVFGLTYQAPYDRERQLCLWKRRFGIKINCPKEESYFDDRVDEVLRLTQTRTLEGWREYAKRFKIEYLVYRQKDEQNPFYQALPGQLVFSNSEYRIKNVLIP